MAAGVTGDHTLRHGGAVDMMTKRFPQATQPWIDLSTGINPWPWPAHTLLNNDPAVFTALPTRQEWEACRFAMAQAFKAPEQCVLPVPGSAMAIAALPSIVPAKSVAILTPSYGDHPRSWSASGAKVSALDGDLKDLGNSDAAVLCNPNNPDGRTFSCAQLARVQRQMQRRGGTLIIDEAYGELDPTLSMASRVLDSDLIVLRSFGKFYGLAGLRLGAVIAAQETLSHLAERLGDWPMSTAALRIGAQAYQDGEYQSQTRARLAKARQDLDTLLKSAGLDICGGTDLFRYVASENARALWHHLATHGLYVRRFDGRDTHLRIGLPGSAAAADRLRAALKGWARL